LVRSERHRFGHEEAWRSDGSFDEHAELPTIWAAIEEDQEPPASRKAKKRRSEEAKKPSFHRLAHAAQQRLPQ
jgi:hypothetical protein